MNELEMLFAALRRAGRYALPYLRKGDAVRITLTPGSEGVKCEVESKSAKNGFFTSELIVPFTPEN